MDGTTSERGLNGAVLTVEVSTVRNKSPNDGPSTSVVARHLIIRGRVQGVNFRASTSAVARRRGVVGWIMNRADGTVEAWLEGPTGDVDAVVSWVRAGGPPAADVIEVRSTSEPPAGHERFRSRG